jgi:hypothetical protein
MASIALAAEDESIFSLDYWMNLLEAGSNDEGFDSKREINGFSTIPE